MNLTPFHPPGFVDHADAPQRTHDDEVPDRVDRARHTADPTGLFAGDIAVGTVSKGLS